MSWSCSLPSDTAADDDGSVLFLVTLAFMGIYLYRHREAGGHCVPLPNNVRGDIAMKQGPMPMNQLPQISPTEEFPPV